MDARQFLTVTTILSFISHVIIYLQKNISTELAQKTMTPCPKSTSVEKNRPKNLYKVYIGLVHCLQGDRDEPMTDKFIKTILLEICSFK